MQRLYATIVGRPWLVLAAVAALTAVLGTGMSRLSLDSSVDTLLPRNDPGKAFYDQVVERFGNDEVNIIGIVAEDVLAETTLEKIKDITDRAAEIEGVASVISLTSVHDPIADVIQPPLLIPTVPRTAAAREDLRARIRDNPLYAGNLIAPDSRGAAINVFLAEEAAADERADRVDAALRALADEINTAGPERAYLTGLSHLKVNGRHLMRRDVWVLTPASLALVIVVFFFAYRTRRGVILPLLCVIVGASWTLGVMGWMGDAVTLGTLVLPSLLVVIGSSYANHVVARYYLEVEAPSGEGKPVQRALAEAGMPVFISALTTGVGFSSLLLNPIQAVRALGLYAVLGIAFLFVLSMTLVPALIVVTPERRYKGRALAPHPQAGAEDGIAGRLARLAQIDIRHRGVIFAVAAVVVAVSLYAVPRIKADTNFLAYFPEDSPVRRDHQAIGDHVAGALPFYVVVGNEEPGSMVTYEALKRLRALQRFIATIPGVTRSVAITDYLDLLDQGLREGAGSDDIIIDDEGNIVEAAALESFWDDPSRLHEVLTLVRGNPRSFRSVITPNFGQANVLVRTTFESSTEIANALYAIQAWAARFQPGDVPVVPTGNIILLTGTTDDVVWGQVTSISVALVVIFLLMSALFVSMKVGFVAMLPNVLPIVMFFGLLGWSGTTLNIGTSIIAAIALGIAVDNTIHYMVRFNRELQLTQDEHRSLATALRTVGRPIVYTAGALTLGFLVMRLSDFVPIRDFGALSAATMVAALATNLLLLPALLAQTRIVTIFDVLFAKLGKDPHLTIPLFHGLRRAQARIAVLLGSLRSVRAGEAAVRQGELGEEMFVIITGAAEVIVHGPDGRPRSVRNLGRGDVFGEMGLVRSQQRTADIIAIDDLELLAVDQRFLQRLQRRYPRIAAAVFLNLTRVLSDRLESTTERFAAAG